MRSLFWRAVERSWQLGIDGDGTRRSSRTAPAAEILSGREGAGRGNHSENDNPQGHFHCGIGGRRAAGAPDRLFRALVFDVARHSAIWRGSEIPFGIKNLSKFCNRSGSR